MEQEEMKARIQGLSSRLDGVETMIRDIHSAIVGPINSNDMGLKSKVQTLWDDRENRASTIRILSAGVISLFLERIWHFLVAK